MKRKFFLWWVALYALLLGQSAAAASPVSVINVPDHALGRYTNYFKEDAGRLTLAQAIAAYDSGQFSDSKRDILNFGIGAKPVWVHFSVDNATTQPVQRRLSIETAWLDQLDIHILHQGKTVDAYQLGDRKPFSNRPIDSRFFEVAATFAPGVSDVFLRVETPDPMALPIYLRSPVQAHIIEKRGHYRYGFLYGFVFALLAYNVMLYAGLRAPRYILYSLYLGTFLLMNMSYTGHGSEWLWPDHPIWAQWSNPLSMVLFGTSGLIFALTFLDTRTFFPRLHRAVVVFLGVTVGLQALAVLFDSQLYSLLIAFTFAMLFVCFMLGLGVVAVRSGQKSATYFLLAAIATILGAMTTTLTVWGVIPVNAVSFNAVEIGMLLDATLLALALTYQFRVGLADKQRAEQLATLDPLTGINNRRAFHDQTTHLWHVSQRNNRNLSLILLDIDQFKRLNDTYGHAYGDEVLQAVVKALMGAIREQDVAARWGGEEFIVLLPETDIREAAALAERLRGAIAAIRPQHAGVAINLTASLGVAQRNSHHISLEELISSADKQLYQAKEAGRNRVRYEGVPALA